MNTKAQTVTDAGNAPRSWEDRKASIMALGRGLKQAEADARTGERIPARVRLHRAAVWDENYAREIGRVQLRAEEINHFDCCGSVAAKIALPQSEIDRLGIDAEDYVYIRRA